MVIPIDYRESRPETGFPRSVSARLQAAYLAPVAGAAVSPSSGGDPVGPSRPALAARRTLFRFRPTSREDRTGAVAVEFALVGPILVLLLLGIISYGGWLWMAQSVQSLAFEGARASIAGLDTAEREQLARGYIVTQATQLPGIDTTKLNTTVVIDAEAIRVAVDLDVHEHALILLAGPLPKPPGRIHRVAIVRIGGY